MSVVHILRKGVFNSTYFQRQITSPVPNSITLPCDAGHLINGPTSPGSTSSCSATFVLESSVSVTIRPYRIELIEGIRSMPICFPSPSSTMRCAMSVVSRRRFGFSIDVSRIPLDEPKYNLTLGLSQGIRFNIPALQSTYPSKKLSDVGAIGTIPNCLERISNRNV